MAWMVRTISAALDRGQASADALRGAWRRELPAWSLEAELLASAADFLLGSGCGGLVWWRLRQSAWEDSAVAAEFPQAYRLHSLQAALHQQHLERVLALLRHAGVDPLLCKGWAVARHYPEPGLRPYGDLDLCVSPDQLPRAAAALEAAGDLGGWVDLHAGIPELADRSWDEVWTRSRRVGAVRVLGAEDQLRQLALHLLRHGAWRPLWLCDVAAAVEAAPADFDWDLCLAGDSRRAQWILAVLQLAERLLGARLPTALLPRLRSLPRWLLNAVLRQWSTGRTGDSHTRDRRPMASYLLQPSGLFRALACRWPNPIEAAFQLGAGPWSHLPILLFQVRFATNRLSRFVMKHRSRRRGSLPAGMSFEVHQS